MATPKVYDKRLDDFQNLDTAAILMLVVSVLKKENTEWSLV